MSEGLKDMVTPNINQLQTQNITNKNFHREETIETGDGARNI